MLSGCEGYMSYLNDVLAFGLTTINGLSLRVQCISQSLEELVKIRLVYGIPGYFPVGKHDSLDVCTSDLEEISGRMKLGITFKEKRVETIH
uniref:Uncharacterized protein n=1 Tax=Romanomermis culicivorax TaxID=13658 RepID=A0A915HJM4_ROMCU